MKVSVFVSSIVARANTSIAIVEAGNGATDSPPFIRFELKDPDAIHACHIGKRYNIEIEEA